MKQYTELENHKHSLAWALWRRSSRHSQASSGVFLANHLANTDNLIRPTKRQHTPTQNNHTEKRGPNTHYLDT